MELIKMPQTKKDGYYMGAMDEEALKSVIQIAHKKRQTDKVIVEYKSKNLKNHLKAADKANVKYCAVIGSNEMRDKNIWVKNLEDKSEYTIPLSEF